LIAVQDIYKLGDNFTTFKWSEALGRTARHVINDKGPCGTPLDFEGETYSQVLERHYAYNFTDLQVIEFDIDFAGMVDYGDDDIVITGDEEDYGAALLVHLLTQDNLDKEWLTYCRQSDEESDKTCHIGISCACNVHKFDWDNDVQAYSCALLVAKDVVSKQQPMRNPIQMQFIQDDGYFLNPKNVNTNKVCASQCSALALDTASDSSYDKYNWEDWSSMYDNEWSYLTQFEWWHDKRWDMIYNNTEEMNLWMVCPLPYMVTTENKCEACSESNFLASDSCGCLDGDVVWKCEADADKSPTHTSFDGMVYEPTDTGVVKGYSKCSNAYCRKANTQDVEKCD
jgi:hypothetical protein